MTREIMGFTIESFSRGPQAKLFIARGIAPTERQRPDTENLRMPTNSGR